MIIIFGGSALLLLVDETSPLLGILNTVYINLYPFFAIGIGILLFFTVLVGVKTLVNQTQKQQNLLKITLIFLGINGPINLIFYYLLNYYSIDILLPYWVPFGIVITNWSELLLNPLILIGAVFTNIVILGSIITLGALLLSLGRKHKLNGLRFPAIFYLFQIIIYIFQFFFSLELYLYFQRDLLVCILLCGFLTCIGFVFLGNTFRKIPTLKKGIIEYIDSKDVIILLIVLIAVYILIGFLILLLY
jgi:hypothetical protein